MSPPVVHRLGIPADLETRLKQKDSLVAPASVLSLMEALPDGRTALVYMDLVRKGSNVGLNVWLSTLDANGHPSCADLRIPVSEYSRPAFGVHGDTLFVLQRAPKAQGGAVISTIARWIVPRC